VTDAYVGSYLHDLETGTSIKLPDIHSFLDFIGNSRILIRPSEGAYKNPGNHVIAFDLNTLTTDSDFMPGDYNWEFDPFDISNDLSKWTLTTYTQKEKDGEKGAYIVVVDFPQKVGR